MNEFDKLVTELDGQQDTMGANGALFNDGVQNPNVQGPATAKAVTMTEHPGQYVKTFEEMGRVEQMWHSLKSGWHNTVMANKMVEVVDAAERATIGAPSTVVDETSYDVQEMLAGDNAVSRAIGNQLKKEALKQARQYGELVAESEQYQPPREIQEMAKKVEGMDLGEGLWEGLKTLWQGDMLGSSIYLFGSSLSAISPELVGSAIGGGALGFATRSSRIANAVRSAVMGMGSSRVEYGSTIADQLQKRGVDVQDEQGLVEALSDEATRAEVRAKSRQRATVVGSFDALAAGLATLKLEPWNIMRKANKVLPDAPRPLSGRIASETGSVMTQATVQGALGGAGEAFGSLAAGDEINPGDVLLEMMGEFTTAPVDVGTAVASESFAYVKGTAQTTEALETEKALNNVSNAVEAIRNELGNEEAVEAWASRVGQDQTLFSFAQDLVDNGSLEKIREINPELATRIETAAEEHQTVEIPVSEMMRIASKDKSLADEIIKDSRTHVDGMTPREAEKFLKEGKDDAMKIFDKIIKRSNSDIELYKQARKITQGISDQLVQAGTRKDVAEMQVKPWEAYLVNRSKALGIKPQELADLIHLQVKADGGVSGTVPNSFASPMTQGKRWRMGPKELDPDERIQVIQFKGQAENRKKAIKQILEIASSGLKNEDSGFVLTASKGDLEKSSGGLFSYNERVIRALAPIFPEVVQKAKWLESSNDYKHQNKDLKGIHYFAVPVEIDGGLYRVKLTVRDYATKGQERLATHAIAAIQIYEIENPLENHSDSGSSDILSNTAPAIRLPATEMQQDRTVSLSELAGGRVQDKRQDGKGLFDPVDESAYSEGGVYYSPEDSFNQSAWHGSPHVFDRFSTDHIGSGEGAQAHGWGLYFANDRKVAEGYRNALAGGEILYKDKNITDLYEQLERSRQYGKLAVIEELMIDQSVPSLRAKAQEMIDEGFFSKEDFDWFEKEVVPNIKQEGRVFEVDIPDENSMLDEQKYMGSSRNTELREKIEWILQEWDYKNPGRPLSLPESPNGREIYQAISDALGGPREASLYLNRFGIKGITYEGGRDGRCYVVFDDKAIDILSFYQNGTISEQGQKYVNPNQEEHRQYAQRLAAEEPRDYRKEFAGKLGNTRDEQFAAQARAVLWGRAKRASYQVGHRDNGALRLHVANVWSADPVLERVYSLNGIDTPTIHELDHSLEAAQAFADAITQAKLGNKYGAAVYVYPVEEYQNMRLFLVENGRAGIAVKENGDIVSVFNNKAGNAVVHSLLNVAIRNGGNHLDCFDTVLPKLYAPHGIRAISRQHWNDEYAPEKWDKTLFAKYNKGEPDVTYMVYDPSYYGEYQQTDGEVIDDYEEAVGQQTEAVQELNTTRDFPQDRRGSYTPGSNLITLMENADKSTFLHESAHAWLDADTMLADSIANKFLAGHELSEGELSLLRNVGGFFRWGQREGVLNLNVQNNDTSIANAIKVWRSMSVREQTGMHELFAQGFESYLIEGTAPNLEMRTLFQRFAQWLKDIYARASNAPKPLSPEVSKLYDLLFISEQEARDAETRAGLMALFDQDDKNINMTAKERKEYDKLNEDAKLEAEGIIRKSVAGVIRTYANIRRQVANRIRIDHKKRVEEVEKQLMLEPRHMVRDALTKPRDWGHNHHPWKYQFDENILRNEGYDQETINALKKKGFVYQSGQRVQAQLIGAKGIATLFGHPEPMRLVQELLDIEPAIDEATKIVAAEVQMQTGQSYETYSQLQPDVAAHNRTRSRFLNAEFNALARMLGEKSILATAAKEYAANKIDEMNVSDVLPYVYVQNEKRCAKMAEKFYRQGKFDHCLEAKRGQIVNFEMARTALSLQEEFEKTVRRTKRAVRSKSLYKPYQSLLIAIAENHDVARHRGEVNPLDQKKIDAILKDLESEGTPVEGIQAYLSDRTSYKNMTVKQARELFAILRELEAIARNRETSNLLREKMRIADIVSEGNAKLDEAAEAQKREPNAQMRVPLTPWNKAKDLLEACFVGHIKIATYCRIFDRNQDNGFFWNLFIRSANERANFENAQREQLTKQLADILIPVFGRKGMFTQDKRRIGNRIMSKGERFAAALNMGNDSNLKRLIKGDSIQWTDENIKALQQSLTSEDWLAVQKIWDLFESLRPMIAEKQKRVYGEEPLWIDPMPQSIQTANGKVDLLGGYYPVVYDPRASNRADRQNDVAQTAQAMRGAFQSATTARSFTKQRVEDPDIGPLRLDLTGLYNGLNDVIHDLAWHEWLIETRRVLNGVNGDNTGLRQSIKELYGYHVAKAFEQWREGIAQGDRVPSDSMGKPILRALAGNVGVASMGFSAMSAVIQLTGIGYAIPRCGAKNVMGALTSYLTHPVNARKTINALSPMMASRARTMNRQIAEVKNRLESGHVNPLQRYAYSMLIAVQSVVDSITWLASYRKAMKMQSVLDSENPDVTAAAIADQDVIDTQSSGNTSDLSAVERSDILEPLTVFYSFMNTAMNQAYSIYKSEENRTAAYSKLIFMGVVMPVAEKLIREALTADDGSDDDDDLDEKIQSLLLTSAGAITEYHLGMFVGLRELSSIVGDTVAGEHAFNYGGPAGTRGIGAMATLVQRVNDPFSSGFVNAAVDVGGALLGLPSTQIKKTIKGIRAIENDDVEGIDAMKAPIFGYSGKIK